MTVEKLRFGEFLELLEVIAPENIDETLSAAKDLDIPIGKATVLRGLLTDDNLTHIVQLHCLVRDGTIDLEDAKDVYRVARRKNMSITQALSEIGLGVGMENKVMLGSLLTESGVVTDKAVDAALELQRLCGLPIGRILYVDAKIPPYLLWVALELQGEIRNNSRSVKSAVTALNTISQQSEYRGSQDQKVAREGDRLNVDDLLLDASVCTQSDLTIIEGFAAVNNLELCDALRYTRLVEPELVSAAAALSGLVEDDYLETHVAKAMFQSLALSITRDTAPWRAITLYQFLVMSGFLTAGDIRRLTRELVESPEEFQRISGLPAGKLRSRAAIKKAIVQCIVDSAKLESVLTTLDPKSRKLISYARDLVSLAGLGRIEMDKAILSFARLRRRMKDGLL